MEIKESDQFETKSMVLIKNQWKKVSKRKHSFYLILVLFFIAIILSSIYLGTVLHKNNSDETIKNIIETNINIVPNSLKGLTATPEKIFIDIKYTDFQKLEYIRQKAISRGILLTSSDDFVPAKINYNGKHVKADIMLKEDWVDSLKGNKWPFRIKIKGNKTLFGMKTMSLQHPRTRNYLTEWFFHKALNREDVLTLRYKFISVTLNGKNLGIFALEEHFEKQLLKNQQRKKGPIISFNENLMREELLDTKKFPNSEISGFGSFANSSIDGFNTEKVLSDSIEKQQFQKAVNLLESFRIGKLKTSEVFDIDLLAKFFAITDLMGTEHGARWNNTKFYYNSITSLLEPIGFDGKGGAIISLIGASHANKSVGMSSQPYYETIFSDTDFYKKYVENLERVSDPLYLQQMFKEIDKELNLNLNILYQDFPCYNFSKDVFYNNQNYIRSILNPTKGLQAYLNSSTKKLVNVEIANIQTLPIEVISIVYNNSIKLLPESAIILPGKITSEPMNYTNSCFKLPEDLILTNKMISDLKINYRILGSSRIMSDSIYNWSHLSKDFIKNDFIRQQPNEKEFEFLVVNDTNKTIYIKPGDWSIDKNLIISEGYHVFAGKGVHIDLSNNAKILSYSPLEFLGSKEDPIIISSNDFTGQGLLVMNTSEKSNLEYTFFEGLSNPSQSGWSLTGAITFYNSPVEFFNCMFTNNSIGDDYLNIVKSEFYLQNCVFDKTIADAIDLDFSKGIIKNTTFTNIENDAIDGTGTIIELKDIFIKNVGGKGISAKEGTNLIGSGIEILNTEIAVSSKDMSVVTIDNITISNSTVAFAIFQKKPEFGSSSGIITKLIINEVNIPYMLEQNSTLLISGKSIKSNYENVDEGLYRIRFGNNSK